MYTKKIKPVFNHFHTISGSCDVIDTKWTCTLGGTAQFFIKTFDMERFKEMELHVLLKRNFYIISGPPLHHYA